jgi:hypothetical protein
MSPFNRRTFLQWLVAAPALTQPLAAARAFASPPAAAPPGAFATVPAAASGIHWRHVAGLSPQKFEPETNGPGCAFVDYDNDGWPDIYLVNSGPCSFYQPPHPLRNALYHNNRDGTFTDVTARAGVGGGGYGMGVAVGDYDGDGYPDLYVTQVGRAILYHNNGDGTFSDVTARAGVAAPGWTTSAVWFDYDQDGKLDLFVGQFALFGPEQRKIRCGNAEVGRLYCRPSVYPPAPSWLFHNNGDGTFTDVSRESGIAAVPGKAWGVVAADVDGDGWLDLFVANDTVRNFLFLNRPAPGGGRRFVEAGALAGVGYSAFGLARSGMGVDAADYNQDGKIDLCVGNLDHENFSLYRNDGGNVFTDVAPTDGLATATFLISTWGAKFLDFDNDGVLDLLLANGHPETSIAKIDPGVTYREPMQLFRGSAAAGHPFHDMGAAAGPAFTQRYAARGLALGDYDNDGAVDALVAVNNAAPLLLRNQAARGRHWLGLRLRGPQGNPDALGAKVTVAGGAWRLHRFQVGGGSFMSSCDPRMVLGLGPRAELDWLEIRWPGPHGAVQRIARPPVDRYITLTHGQPGWK